jgi:hypothetical protein
MKKNLGLVLLVLAALSIVLGSCGDPSVSNREKRHDSDTAGSVPKGGPAVTNGSLPAPTGVTASIHSSGRIRIEWEPVPAATGYVVYFGDPDDQTMSYYEEIEKSYPTFWEDYDELTSGYTYYYQVQALDESGSGLLSIKVSQLYSSQTTTTDNPFIGTWRNISDSTDTMIFNSNLKLQISYINWEGV